MSSANRENTITGRVANYLRENNISAETFKSQEMPGKTYPVEPDFTIENGSVFFGEAKWESDYFEAIAEARDYGLIPSKGTFAIGYPEELKQRRLTDYTSEEESLSGHQYRVAFLRPDAETDMTSLPIEKVPEWLYNHLYERVEPKTDPDEAVVLLRQIATAFTREFDSVETPDLFRNVLGVTPSEDQQANAAKRAAGYLLIDQIAFYRVLSSTGKYREIKPDRLKSPSDLQAYFEDVLEDNYAAIFSFPVAEAYPQEALPLLRRGIKSIYGLAPNRIDHEVLGTVFHSLTPASVRKPLGAYYTKNKTAEILAELSVNGADDTVIDPSCGSGTLLTAAYRRKREHHLEFTETDHRKFVEEDLTGIDIMPFASHLSTIHLALERPIYQTDEVRIGIDDATKLRPGISIPPLSYALPEALTGQKSIDDYAGDMKWQEETVEQGSVTADGIGDSSISLKEEDVVIMNPPFSRQESVAHFSNEYKSKLKTRFNERDEKGQIHGKMSYCSYFFFLADDFLKEGGRVAAVVPATMLNKKSDNGVRQMLVNEYDIEYILAREDEPNYSEDTDFREVLIIARKDDLTEESTTAFISHSGFDISTRHIREAASSTDAGEIFYGDNFTLQQVSVRNLNVNDLFTPFSLSSPELISSWERITNGIKLTSLSSLDVGLIRGIGSNADGIMHVHPECSLNDPDAHTFGSRDVYVFDGKSNECVIARHRYTDETFTIPKEHVAPNLRRYAGRQTIDLSGIPEYVVLNDDWDGAGRYLLGTEEDEIHDKWSDRVDKRRGHIALVRRVDLTAPGTHHLAYYSDERRLFNELLWVLPKATKPEAKILAAWFDSTLGWLQSFINRIETRGAWLTWYRYIVSEYQAPELQSLSQNERDRIISAFDSVRQSAAPSFYEQLALNVNPDDLTQGEIEAIRDAYEGLADKIGDGYEPRRTLDRAILDIAGIEAEHEEFIDRLYQRLLYEIVVLKRMMG